MKEAESKRERRWVLLSEVNKQRKAINSLKAVSFPTSYRYIGIYSFTTVWSLLALIELCCRTRKKTYSACSTLAIILVSQRSICILQIRVYIRLDYCLLQRGRYRYLIVTSLVCLLPFEWNRIKKPKQDKKHKQDPGQKDYNKDHQQRKV